MLTIQAIEPNELGSSFVHDLNPPFIKKVGLG